MRTLRVLIFIFAALSFIAVIAWCVLGVVEAPIARFFLAGSGFVVLYYVLGFMLKDDEET